MKTLILTKNQIWQLATLVQHYDIDSIRLHIDYSSGIGPIIKAEIGNERDKIDITDISNW